MVLFFMGCKTYNAPSGKYFPWSWGEPPKIQTKDYVPLPEGYGHGSSTLKHWIELNIERDKINRKLNKFQIPLSEIAD